MRFPVSRISGASGRWRARSNCNVVVVPDSFPLIRLNAGLGLEAYETDATGPVAEGFPQGFFSVAVRSDDMQSHCPVASDGSGLSCFLRQER